MTSSTLLGSDGKNLSLNLSLTIFFFFNFPTSKDESLLLHVSVLGMSCLLRPSSTYQKT